MLASVTMPVFYAIFPIIFLYFAAAIEGV